MITAGSILPREPCSEGIVSKGVSSIINGLFAVRYSASSIVSNLLRDLSPRRNISTARFRNIVFVCLVKGSLTRAREDALK